MSRELLLRRIRTLASRPVGLFRIHHTHTSLYARARRLFGSWAEAVRSSGLEYDRHIDQARRRSLRTRRMRRIRRRRPT